MIQIRYGENYEVADLSGKSIAEVREQFKQAFGISGKAEARLGGKRINRKHEAETWLSADDQITFANPSRKGLFFAASILLAMVVTSSVFAYGATTTTVGLVVSGTTDFAAVTPAGTPPAFNVYGSYTGKIPTNAGNLFIITPETGFTGDMVALITVTNAHTLSSTYRVLVMEIEVWDTATTPVNVDGPVYLTLSKGKVSLDIDQSGHTAPYHVRLVGGFYVTHKGGWSSGDEDPNLLCDVIQWGAS